MAFSLKTECITCGHSIPLAETYCGGDECLNCYTAENEHADYSYAQYKAWDAGHRSAEPMSYHDWARAHMELADLECNEFIDHHDQDDINALRRQLNLATA